MGRRRGPVSVALILLVLGLVGMGVVTVAWWPFGGLSGEGGADPGPVQATVVRSVPCDSRAARDVVELTVDGRRQQARFDGCGHRVGRVLRVEVSGRSGGQLLVGPADADGGAGDLRQRLSWVLLTLSGVAGAGYGLMLRARVRR